MPNKDEQPFSILSACQDIHMAVTGAFDPMGIDAFHDLDAKAKTLKERFKNWKPSPFPAFAPYDSAVMLLVLVTLSEWERWLEQLKNESLKTE